MNENLRGVADARASAAELRQNQKTSYSMLDVMSIAWSGIGSIASQEYICGYCGNLVASALGYKGVSHSGGFQNYIAICPHCNGPTFFMQSGARVPGSRPGSNVGSLPVDIQSLYDEARDCVASSANTAAVLLCRKLLMNLAVDKGATEGESFISYVEYLATEGYIPPSGRDWVDHIRTKGNEANHEIHLMSETDANDLISLAEMLLKIMYEFPARIPAS